MIKVPPPQFSSETLRLSVCLAYCLSWEIAGKMLRENWSRLRAVWQSLDALKPEDRRLIELYEEFAPTVSEERYLTHRIEKLVPTSKSRQTLALWMLSCLPDELEKAAARHPLIRDWLSPTERSLPFRLLRRPKAASGQSAEELFPAESEREEDFAQFLAMPGFEKIFEHYWHQPPKNRTNRLTRALVTVAAILSHFFTPQQFKRGSALRAHLKGVCHFSDATVDELCDIARKLESHWYQTADLAYRLLVDTRPRDRLNIAEMIRTLDLDERTTDEDRKTFHEVLDLASGQGDQA
ncbi:hypothetical protein H5P28_07910 [Ruficoccus amylovorans]|uniref:Uncharacterized protein n=1 Tax=Ruficoccus amylovorans TaxID=1804625 RepID=A0A842HCG6_9BACT|nr:hypothetical protein [Ruficoccus amylovorans]MBC2594185.1 hypothetical protein [Ruficoccus amylovorans]